MSPTVASLLRVESKTKIAKKEELYMDQADTSPLLTYSYNLVVVYGWNLD